MNDLREAFERFVNSPYEPTPPPMIIVSPRHKLHKAMVNLIYGKRFSKKTCPVCRRDEEGGRP